MNPKFHNTMVKSFFPTVLLLVSQFGTNLAFSNIKGARTSVATTVRTTAASKTTVSKPALSRSLFASSSNNEDPVANNAFHERRSFLAKFAAASLSPLFTLINPVTAHAYAINDKGPLVFGADDIMSQKEHGTTSSPVQDNLRYGVSRKLADKICSFNRVFAEMGGYFEGSSTFEKDVRSIVASTGEPVTFYDSVSGKSLFKAPVNRSVDEFISESKVHGWPSFRDDEVVWNNVRVLKSSGETVSTDGTHLGHNIPDKTGNRYCINLVSIAGNP